MSELFLIMMGNAGILIVLSLRVIHLERESCDEFSRLSCDCSGIGHENFECRVAVKCSYINLEASQSRPANKFNYQQGLNWDRDREQGLGPRWHRTKVI